MKLTQTWFTCISLALCSCASSTGSDAGTDALTNDRTTINSDSSSVDSNVSPDANTSDSANPQDGGFSDRLEPSCDLPTTYTFGYSGGLVAYTSSASIAPGRVFTYTRTPVRGFPDAGPSSCTTSIDHCSVTTVGRITTLHLINALNNSDVMAAFNGSRDTLYGRDTRPVDGSIFIINRMDGARIQIGSPCSGASGCIEIPAGVAQLQEVLNNLINQELQNPQCSALR